MFPKWAAFPLGISAIMQPASGWALDLEYSSHLSLYYPQIGVSEPSGLAIDATGTGFWIVSDESDTVFRLEANGGLWAFTGGDRRLRDLEGITVDMANERLLLVSEQTASIIEIPLSPPHQVSSVQIQGMRSSVDLGNALTERDNGLEGVTVDPASGAVFVLKEAEPRLLVEIAPTLDRIISVRNLDEVLPEDEDVSGLAVDPRRSGLWIVSDRGKSVHFLPHDASAVASFDLVWRKGNRLRQLDNAEGVAISPDGRSLFVVTDDDRHSLLVQYNILDGD